jgi:hypothetical protein
MIRKLFSLIFIVVAVFFVSHLEYQGKPVKQHFQEFYEHPVVQKSIRQIKLMVKSYLEKDVGDKSPADHITDDDRRELEKLLKRELEKVNR